MAEGFITARGASKAGKPTVSIDGKLFYAGNTDLGGLVVGDRISYTSTSFADGKLWGIDKGWKLLQPAGKYPPSQEGKEAITALARPREVLSGITEGERLSISNWVGQAIASGCIKAPEEIEKWVSAAKNAIRSQSE